MRTRSGEGESAAPESHRIKSRQRWRELEVGVSEPKAVGGCGARG